MHPPDFVPEATPFPAEALAEDEPVMGRAAGECSHPIRGGRSCGPGGVAKLQGAEPEISSRRSLPPTAARAGVTGGASSSPELAVATGALHGRWEY